MEKEFIPYEQALALKELGFDEPCLGKYDPLKILVTISRPNNNSYYKGSVPSFISAPLYQQAFRWLYEKLDIEKGVIPLDNKAQQLLLKKLIEIVKDEKRKEIN